MKRLLPLGLVLFLAAFSTAAWLMPAATAELSASAVYSGSDEQGVITIQAAPRTRFQVFAEQPDGSLVQVGCGMVTDQGSAWVGVVPNGVLGNGLPMFMVRVGNLSGESLWLSVPIGESDDHLWGWL